MRRYRTCDNPRPANGGRACTGSDAQIQKCNAASCPGTALVQIRQTLCGFYKHIFQNHIFYLSICVCMCIKLTAGGVHGSHGVNVQHPVGVENAHASDSVTIRHLATTAVLAQETPPSYPDVTYSHVQVQVFHQGKNLVLIYQDWTYCLNFATFTQRWPSDSQRKYYRKH